MFIINTKDFYVNNFILTHNQHKKVTPGILLCKVQNTKKKKKELVVDDFGERTQTLQT